MSWTRFAGGACFLAIEDDSFPSLVRTRRLGQHAAACAARPGQWDTQVRMGPNVRECPPARVVGSGSDARDPLNRNAFHWPIPGSSGDSCLPLARDSSRICIAQFKLSVPPPAGCRDATCWGPGLRSPPLRYGRRDSNGHRPRRRPSGRRTRHRVRFHTRVLGEGTKDSTPALIFTRDASQRWLAGPPLNIPVLQRQPSRR